jgi:hypothetical protein
VIRGREQWSATGSEGERSSASARTVRSRSVTIADGSPSPSQITTEPIERSRISWATLSTSASARAVTTLAVMISRSCMGERYPGIYDPASMSEPGSCPLCGQPLYGWVVLPVAGAEATIGAPLPAEAGERIVDRCERCGVAVEREVEIDLSAEWDAVCRPAGSNSQAVATPNRASVQAWIGEVGWAGIDRSPGRLMHTRDSLELLASRNDRRLERVRTPVSARAQGWMWQTMLNGLTFHRNFAREVRAGRLRPGTGRGRAAFAIDAVVTVLGAPLVLLLSAPAELVAALARRGGELAARASASGGSGRPG